MVQLHEMVFRDAHQSLLATRMRTEDMLPIAEKIDQVGFFSFEVWGGATFDVPIRYLNEDPWERLKTLKEHLPNTPLQMLERAMNIVAYRNFPDDIVKKFIHYAVKDGCDNYRIFDALNDMRNMKVPIETVVEEGGHAQGCISYTISPIHTVEKFVDELLQLEKMGCHSVCIKDMAGMIFPKEAYAIIKGFKDAGGKVPIDLHTHSTSGMEGLSYQRAAEAGVDILDTAMSPISGGTAGPPTESIVQAFAGTEWDTGYDINLLMECRDYFLGVWDKYRHLHRMKAIRPDPSVTVHQIPGGMLSNLVSQLEQQGAAEKYYDVLAEVPKVRAEMGYPPLVTPTSQVVGVQAVMNVLFGRYKVIPNETKEYVRGMYGTPPGEISKEMYETILGANWKDEIIDCRPADLLEPQWEYYEDMLKEQDLLKKPEDVLTVAIYPQVGLKFLKGEAAPEFTSDQLPLPVDHALTKAYVKSEFPEVEMNDLNFGEVNAAKVGGPAPIPTQFNVVVNGEPFEVEVEPTGGYIVTDGSAGTGAAAGPPKDIEGGIKSPMQGTILKVKVEVGDTVEEGDVVAILEAMKMEQEVKADHGGEVKEIYVEEGDTVAPDDLLLQIL